MKVTFKSYDDLRALCGENIEVDFDRLLKNTLADKTYLATELIVNGESQSFVVQLPNGNVAWGGKFTCDKDWFKDVDYGDNKDLWRCGLCDFTVNPKERYHFGSFNETYESVGIENCACPLCFTYSMRKVNKD